MAKKLYRIEQGKVLCGVCGGIAEYFDLDYNLIRILFVLVGLTGTAIIAYIVAAVILPTKSEIM